MYTSFDVAAVCCALVIVHRFMMHRPTIKLRTRCWWQSSGMQAIGPSTYWCTTHSTHRTMWTWIGVCTSSLHLVGLRFSTSTSGCAKQVWSGVRFFRNTMCFPQQLSDLTKTFYQWHHDNDRRLGYIADGVRKRNKPLPTDVCNQYHDACWVQTAVRICNV